MPKLNQPIIPLGDDYAIGVVIRGTKPYWYVRFLHRNRNQCYYKSTKVEFGIGREDGLPEAREKANKIYREWFRPRIERGQIPTQAYSPQEMSRQFLEEAYRDTLANEELIAKGKKPVYEIRFGSGYWNRRRYNDSVRLHHSALYDFFREKGLKDIADITQKDLNAFSAWCLRHQDWSPSRVNKALTELRWIWRFAHEKGYVTFIPTLRKANPNLQERTRRKITVKEYELILKTARKHYKKLKKKANVRTDWVEKQFQFIAWIMLMANSGTRPSTGTEDRLLIKWKDIFTDKIKDRDGNVREIRFLTRHGEKKHLDYDAILLPACYEYLDALKEMYRKKKIKTEYVFAHTNEGKAIALGDPIKSFKMKWIKTLKACGLDMPVGTPQSENLVPYTLRGFFITQMLQNTDVRPSDLARATGTSEEMINVIYYGYRTKDVANTLLEGLSDSSQKIKSFALDAPDYE